MRPAPVTLGPMVTTSNRKIENRRFSMVLIGISAMFIAILIRLFVISLSPQPRTVYRPNHEHDRIAARRPDILDRNGRVLATDVMVASLYAEPIKILDTDAAFEAIRSVFPDLDTERLYGKLTSKRGFIWLKREISPAERKAIHDFGILGIGFMNESRRIYPAGRSASHFLGSVDVDSAGISGLEMFIDNSGLEALRQANLVAHSDLAPLTLSVDLRVQHRVHQILERASRVFSIKKGCAVVLDVVSGEILAMVSLPDFDPNRRSSGTSTSVMNLVTAGSFEMGSIFKAFTVAMIVDMGLADDTSTFDARKPLAEGGIRIGDYHPQRRILTLAEVFTYSSNIGAARMAMAIGDSSFLNYLGKFGLLDQLAFELPESASPQIPGQWRKANTLTAAFGHGLAVTPLQTTSALASLVNGGTRINPTLIKTNDPPVGPRIIKESTSEFLRNLLHLNAVTGTARRSQVPGIPVGGKTGTAEKVVNGQYASDRLRTTFFSAFPIQKPQYLVFVLLDEPQPRDGDHGRATAGLNAAPVAAQIVYESAGLLGISRISEIDAGLNWSPPLPPSPSNQQMMP